MAKTKKLAFGGLGNMGFTRGSQPAPPNLKNNRLTPAQMTPGSPSGGQMSMPTQPYSGQVNMPKNGILNTLSGGAFNRGTQRPPQSGIPTQMPTKAFDFGSIGMSGPRLPTNLPPRDFGTGNGPRFIEKTPGSIGANPNRSVFRDGPNDAPQSVMDDINLGKNPVGLGNGMAAPENMLQQSPNAASMAQKAYSSLRKNILRDARGFGPQFKKGGAVKVSKPKTSSASSRGDGIAQRGKTKGRMV